MKKKVVLKKIKKLPVRIPTAPPTVWHKDKTTYNRIVKHKSGYPYYSE